MIYQLAKTTPLLSGQVKWDLVMSSNKVTQFQLVPISEHIPFNHNQPNDLLNYSHGDNLKRLYEKISGSFYSPVTDPNLSVEHLHRSVDLYQDTHENTYEMGMKRMSFPRYKKQFSFFCPFWCDNINDFNNLSFKIVVKNAKKKNRILYSSKIDMSYIAEYMQKYFDTLGLVALADDHATLEYKNKYYKQITWEEDEKKKYPNHDLYRLIDNVKDYGENIGIYHPEDGDLLLNESTNLVVSTSVDLANTENNDYKYLGTATYIDKHISENTDLLYIDFENYRAWVKGINVKTGNVQTCECSQLVNNITSQERPMLEVDNMMANTFAENNLICTQLFNFNFVFNLDDFLPIEFIKNIYGEKLNIYVDMYVGDEKVEVRDFYSNYEKIPRYDTKTGKYDTSYNALDYLSDNENIDLINKNKLVQSTFHWSLQSNQSVLFNMYDGISPLYDGQEKTHGLMNDFTNMYASEYHVEDNTKSIFKYEYHPEINLNNCVSVLEKIIGDNSDYDDSNFYSVSTKNNNREYQWFGNLLINNKKLEKQDWECTSGTISKVRSIYIKMDINYSKEFYLKTIAPSLVEWGYNYEDISGVIGIEKDFLQKTEDFIHNKRIGAFLKIKNNIATYLFLEFYGDDVLFIKNNLYFKGILSTSEGLLKYLKKVFRCAEKPHICRFDKSVSTKHYNSPDIISTENEYEKTDKTVYIQRYDLLVYPYFVSIDNEYYKNNVYWCKQYINNVNDGLNKADDVDSFNKYSFTKFAPKYPSIGYYVLKNSPLDYETFYMKEIVSGLLFEGDISWYKNNSLFLLPNEIDITYTGEELTEEKIKDLLYEYLNDNLDIEKTGEKEEVDEVMLSLFEQKIYKLYKTTFTFDYASETDITTYIYKIKYSLR